MSESFPVEQFRDVFQLTPKIKNKLQPFMTHYKDLNMDWIINSLQQLYGFFFEEKNDIMLKFNSIFGIKFLFDTAEVVLVNLIEIYFLPRIFEIASFDARGNQEKRGTGYFVSVGYPKDTPDVQKLSYNFVRLASEFIQVASTVKSRRLYLNEEIDDPSDYFEACQRLQEQGWKPYPKPAYYKDTAPAIAAQFKKSLEAFDQAADPYIDFYVDIFRLFLEKNRAYQGRLNPKRVLQTGDVYVTGPVIDLCSQALKSHSVRQRLNAIGLLNDFIRWCDIEAAYTVNCTNAMDELLHELANTNSGIMNLSRGKSMFAKLQSSEQLKQQLYVEALKAIQFWSLCFPRAIKIKGKDSKIKQAHDELRMKLKIQFPQDKSLKESKMQFDRNIVKKRKRNVILLKQLQNEDPDYVSIVHAKRNEESSGSIQQKSIPVKEKQGTIKEMSVPVKVESFKQIAQTAQPTGGDFGRIKANINEAKVSLNTLLDSEAALPQKMQKLVKFKKEFENNVESADVTDEEFDELLQTGTPLVDKIQKVLPHLNSYANKKISFAELTNLINNPGKSRVKEESPIKKEAPPQPVTASKPKIEEPPKMEKNIKLDEVSLKVEEKSIKSVEKTSLKPQSIKEAIPEPTKVSRTMPQVEERVSKGTIKAVPQIKSQKTQQINNRFEQAKLDIKPVTSQSRKVEPAQITPIKKMQQEERERFSQEHSMSSLPQISKQSLSKSLDEEVNIEPASHQILQERDVINLNLFKEKERFSTSLKKDNSLNQANLGDFGKKQSRFEEQIEHDVEVNPPRVIDNVNGSYKFKPEAPIIRSPGGPLKESRASSRKDSRIDFQKSKVSKIDAEDEDDIIMMPEINPLELSFHDIGYEEQIKQNKELSFKKCFQAEKYLLGPNKNTKMFWLEKDTMSLIKPGGRKNSRNKDSTVSIPQILSEKDRKYQEELKYIEDQKNRRIRQLEKTVNNLQSQGKQLQLKIVEQDKEIKSFKAESSVSNSRAKKNFYLEDQDQLFRTKHAQKNGREKQRSFYDEPRIKESKCLQPQGKLISSRKYAEYFACFSDEKRKKSLLKNKELLFKDESIEFGCMSKREGDTLIVTFYITPENDLQGLTCKIDPVVNSPLSLTVEPRHITSIRRKKQEKVIVSVNITDVPYQLPEIEFFYNLSGMRSQRFTVPCAFHKFVRIDPASEKDLLSRFQSGRVIRGEEVPYSRKLLKNLESLAEYFPNGTLVRGGQPNENGEIQFGGKAEWKGDKFWLKILIKPSQFLCVQATGDELGSAVEFYISLVTSLLMKNVELSQMRSEIR